MLWALRLCVLAHRAMDVPKKVSLRAMLTLTLLEEFLHKGQRALSYMSRFQMTVRKSIDATHPDTPHSPCHSMQAEAFEA